MILLFFIEMVKHKNPLVVSFGFVLFVVLNLQVEKKTH